MIYQDFHNCFDNKLPLEQCGKMQEEPSPKTGRRRRWDNLVKPIQSRITEGQGKMEGSLTPQKRDSVAVREISMTMLPQHKSQDVLTE